MYRYSVHVCHMLYPHLAMLGMQQEGQSKGGRAFQRPDTHVKMLPVKLSLHDPIMWETWNATSEEMRVKTQDEYSQTTSKLQLFAKG